ncbi:MAG: RNA polymerase-binding protein DksA [Rickettsiales bacterium]|jgi:DnaK suppressor protein|nr:RNA polymerase-binding protein DksA [Rickettsiales bacterium]
MPEKKKVKTPEPVVLPKGYRLSEKDEYMNPLQLEYFRLKLLKWRKELVDDSRDTLRSLVEETADTYGTSGDDVDRANDEALKQLELRTRDRERKLIKKIDEALERIDVGDYGYSEISGEPIGLKRLEAKPTAEMTMEEQKEHEAREKLYK